jgi:exodeoxyribonuclease V alpha subunit
LFQQEHDQKGEAKLLCQFEKLIYPSNIAAVGINSYMIALYRPCEKILDTSGNRVTQVKAVGYCLPTADNLRYEIQGHWSKNPKHGVQYEVESYEEVIVPSKEGIIAYLSSGQIKGIGSKMAERIFDAFGLNTLNVLDHEPEKLLTISGISKTKLKKICDSYLANRGARDVVAFLAPHGITPNRAVQLYREYGNETMEIVKNHPYRLCEIAGIGFRSADQIAMNMGFAKVSAERVDEGLMFTLTEAEGKGHLCMEKKDFVKTAMKILDTPELTIDMVANRAAKLVSAGRLSCYKGYVYRARTAETEQQLAERIHVVQRSSPYARFSSLDQEINREEQKLGIRLDPEQRTAITTALQSPISVITGGPGTGKTSIQKAILDIYRRQNPGGRIVCCAPTGRAARRMEQSTGHPASTVHKALGLIAGDDGQYGEPESFDADLVLIDEVSMLDIYLAKHVLRSVPKGCQLVLIGDADQLPSVGPGAVLSEIIKSDVIPVVRLDRVHRQNAGSRIATNAKLIRHGNLSLEYGTDFQFLDSSSIAESAEKIEKLYLQEIAKYGVDNVALLSPYRQKTETGVAALNERIRKDVNPQDPTKGEITLGKKTFRTGDKVMQIKNHEDVNNGDIGYITDISGIGNDAVVCIDFGDGRNVEYDASELNMLDLGYASTIHKSQGSEYQSVIINLQCAHSIMLVRPLIYTAITRAKKQVIIVGERRALCIAIKKQDTEKRGTQLAERLKELSH